MFEKYGEGDRDSCKLVMSSPRILSFSDVFFLAKLCVAKSMDEVRGRLSLAERRTNTKRDKDEDKGDGGIKNNKNLKVFQASIYFVTPVCLSAYLMENVWTF